MTIPRTSPVRRRRRAILAVAVAVAVATVGLGLNLRAMILLGPHLHERFGVGSRQYVLAIALPLLVAALVRLPVGVLTDRVGARVMFPAVSLIAAAAVFGLAMAGSPLRRCAETARLACTASLSLLYALALGGVAAVAVFLPIYLTSVFDLGWFRALAVTGVLVAVAAAGRFAGGWWADRRPTTGLLVVCYTVAACLCLVVAVTSGRWWLSVPAIAAICVCDGLASDALLALIGKAARPGTVGAVLGAAGAAAAVGTLLIPLLLAGVDLVSHSYLPAWILLAVVLFAGAAYVRRHGLHIGLGLPVRYEPEPSPTALTVAVVTGADVHVGATAAVVGRLAELAMSDELIVVYGTDDAPRPPRVSNVLLDGLRYRLPRHQVVALPITAGDRALGLAAPLDEFVEAGTVPIAVTPTAAARDVAAEVCSYLQADRVLVVSYTTAVGAGLDEVWRRGPHAA